MAATINPDQVLKELAELWVSLGKEGSTEQGVLRACAMTLVVFAEPGEDPNRVGETLAELMRDHPSRTIVVKLDRGDVPLSARVFAQCWMPFGSRRQICCEQIEITGSVNKLDDVNTAILPLLAPDLPVIYWVRDPDLFCGKAFRRIAPVATKIVVDSAAADDPGAVLREVVRYGSGIADLPWVRLTRWRQLVAQVFENPAYLAWLPKVNRVVLRHAGDELSSSGKYFAAWLELGLKAAGATATVQLEPTERAEGNLSALEVSAPGFTCVLEKVDATVVEARVNDVVSRSMFRPPTDFELLQEELAVSGKDPVFNQVLAHLRRSLT